MITTRRLHPGEGPLYRAVRLAALRDAPDAFATCYEDALARSDESWAEQADASASGPDRATFIAMENDPVGLAALYRDEQDFMTGELIQMWVAPHVRGADVAAELLRVVFSWAATNHFLRVKAEVIKTNARALRFYEKSGFSLSAGNPTASSVVLLKTVGQACLR
jgi:RimJ/RimL family protein N-acetyltransferase